MFRFAGGCSSYQGFQGVQITVLPGRQHKNGLFFHNAQSARHGSPVHPSGGVYRPFVKNKLKNCEINTLKALLFLLHDHAHAPLGLRYRMVMGKTTPHFEFLRSENEPIMSGKMNRFVNRGFLGFQIDLA